MAGTSAKRELAITALLSSPSIEGAAEAAGVGTRTLFRWLRDPDFLAEYREARRHSVTAAIARMQQVCAAAVTTLEAVMSDPEAPASSRVQAARTVLDMALRACEYEDLEARISALEATQ